MSLRDLLANMRKIILGTGESYHVLNRGVDKRIVFETFDDYNKFQQYLYLFNDANYRNPGTDPLYNEVLLAGAYDLQHERDPLVSIISYCLLPNHFHLELIQKQDKGIEKFMHKLQMGFARYFNRQNNRRGRLFEAVYLAIHITEDAQYFHLPRYIHCNALDLTSPSWREGRVDDWPVALKQLDNYMWSSHGAYMGRKQDLPIVDMVEVRKIFPTPASYKAFLQEWACRELPCASGLLETGEVT
jgi:putative transposase